MRWIKQRLVHDGLQLNEVAILARSLEAYRPFLIEVAAEFGMPLHLVGGTPLIDNPAIAALLSLLALPVLDWPRRPILEAWRNPYFAWPAQSITAPDASTLDHVSRIGRVIGGVDQWREAFQMLTHTQPNAATDDEDQAESGLSPVDAALLHRKFEAFIDALTPPAQATLRDYAAFVEDLIGDPEADDTGVGLVAQLRQNPHTFDRDFAALQAFKDALRGLVLSEATLGEAQPIDYRTFMSELRGAVEAMSYSPDGNGAASSPPPCSMRAACHFAQSRCWAYRKENFRRPSGKACCCVKPIGPCCANAVCRSNPSCAAMKSRSSIKPSPAPPIGCCSPDRTSRPMVSRGNHRRIGRRSRS